MKPAVQLAIVVGTLAASVCWPVHAAFTVSGRSILRDGTPFQVRGVDYQPAPIGENPAQAAPFGDYYTATYAAIQERDLPLMREMGVNVIRIYGWDPDANHTAFLDACYNEGSNPIFVLVNRWIDPATDWANTAAVNAIRNDFLTLETNLDDHAAVLGLVLGNEANNANGNGTNPAFWSAINSVAASIKTQNPARLVSTAITDALPQVSAHDATMTALDFWSIQVYRGTTFGSFFTQYAAASARPLIVTEFGVDAFNQTTGQPYPNNAEFTGDTIAALWGEVAANSAVCVGACVFEFTDEWWKTSSGSASIHDNGGFPLGGLPDGFANEEWWGLYAVTDNGTLPDLLTPRAGVALLRDRWTFPTVEISAQPESQTVAPGGDATLSVSASASDGGALLYQWLKDDVPIQGATDQSIAFTSLTNADTGSYTVRVTSGSTTATSEAARLLVATPVPGKLVALSTRCQAGVADSTLIVGFVVAGGTADVLVRGIGPALEDFAVADFLPDPRLTLFAGSTIVGENDDWSDAPTDLSPVFDDVSAFPLDRPSSDAALTATLSGLHTAHISGKDGSIGIALAEIYEVAAGNGRLKSISTRAESGPGDDVLIVGFVISGNVPRRIMVRGIGPGLIPFDVSDVLADPYLHVFDAESVSLASNDNWGESPNRDAIASAATAANAFALEETSLDAVILRTFLPGLYTAHVSGEGQTRGVALIEIYEVL